MATLNLGTLLVKLKADTTDFVKGIKESEKSTLKFADGVKLAMGGVAVNALQSAGTAMLQFGMDSITAASDAEEAWSKFAVVFKDDAANVEAQLDAIATSSGLSVNQLVSFASTLGDTFVPLGFTTTAAGDLASQVTQLAVDLASFNNLNTADVVRDFQSALVGNTETLRKYGIVASIATIKEEALASGLWDGTGALSAQAKASAILNIAMAGTADAQGDAARTSEGFANQSKALEGAVLDLQIELGQGLLPVALDVVGALIQITNQAMPAVKAATGDYGDTVADVTKKMEASVMAQEDVISSLASSRKSWELSRTTLGKMTGTTDEVNDHMLALLRRMAESSDSYAEFEENVRDAGITQVEQNSILEQSTILAERNALEFFNLANALAEAESADAILMGTLVQKTAATEEATFAAKDYTDQIDFEAIAELDLAMAAEQAQLAIENKALADEAAAMAAEELALSTENARLALSGYFIEALNAAEPTTNLALALFETASSAGLDAEAMVVLALATGEFTQAEIDAAFQAALMQANIDTLVQSMKNGEITANEAATALGMLEKGEVATAEAAIGMIGDMNNASSATMGLFDSAVAASGAIKDVGSAINSLPTEKRIKILVETEGLTRGQAAAVAPDLPGSDFPSGGIPNPDEFSLGGFTGAGGSGIAGLVHHNEFVFSPPAVEAIGLPALNAMHDMAKSGGLAQAGGVNVEQLNVNAAPGMDEQQLARGVNVQLGTLLRQNNRSGAGLTGLG